MIKSLKTIDFFWGVLSEWFLLVVLTSSWAQHTIYIFNNEPHDNLPAVLLSIGKYLGTHSYLVLISLTLLLFIPLIGTYAHLGEFTSKKDWKTVRVIVAHLAAYVAGSLVGLIWCIFTFFHY
jgi:hypothetical protein